MSAVVRIRAKPRRKMKVCSRCGADYYALSHPDGAQCVVNRTLEEMRAAGWERVRHHSRVLSNRGIAVRYAPVHAYQNSQTGNGPFAPAWAARLMVFCGTPKHPWEYERRNRLVTLAVADVQFRMQLDSLLVLGGQHVHVPVDWWAKPADLESLHLADSYGVMGFSGRVAQLRTGLLRFPT